MKLFKFLKGRTVSVKMKELYEEINKKANVLEIKSTQSFSKKELANWYAKKVKTYETIIDDAEQRVGLKNVCGKGCSSCCTQAIYINPAEYVIISKYVEQLSYSEKELLRRLIL